MLVGTAMGLIPLAVTAWIAVGSHGDAEAAASARMRYLAAADLACLRYEDRRPAGVAPGDRAGVFRHLTALESADRRFLAEWSTLRPPADLRTGHALLRAIAAEWAVTLETVWAGLERDGDPVAAREELERARPPMTERFADAARGMGLRACAGEHDGPESSTV